MELTSVGFRSDQTVSEDMTVTAELHIRKNTYALRENDYWRIVSGIVVNAVPVNRRPMMLALPVGDETITGP